MSDQLDPPTKPEPEHRAQVVTPRHVLARLRYRDPENPGAAERLFIETFLAALEPKYAEIREWMQDWQDNPKTCNCTNKIARLISVERDKVQGVLDEVFGAGHYELQVQTRGRPLTGETRLIDATAEAYSRLMTELMEDRRAFRGLTVVDREEEGQPKWLVLFW